MFDGANFRDLVSGRRSGLGSTLARGLLRLAETPYAMAMRWRNWRYDRGAAKVYHVGVPVVSVGNLTVGGTGKTPMVQWLARWFRTRDVRVVLVSRGYGAQAGSLNDEALELEQRLADVPHLQNPHRVAAARVAIEEFGSQLILLDDAFQHRRIARDLDIVLIDAVEPFGLGHVLPRGLLREPLSGLARADVAVLSRADMVEPPRREAIRRRVQRYAPGVAWIETLHRPRVLRSSSGKEANISALAGKRVAAFCGIGNPSGFRHTLDVCRYQAAAFRALPDHHNYRREDVESLAEWADGLGVEALVTTHKDLVKIGVDRLGGRPLWALVIDLEIIRGQEALEEKLRPLAERARCGEEGIVNC